MKKIIDPEQLLLKAHNLAVSVNRERKLDSLIDNVNYIPFKLQDLENSEEFKDYIMACGPQGYCGYHKFTKYWK